MRICDICGHNLEFVNTAHIIMGPFSLHPDEILKNIDVEMCHECCRKIQPKLIRLIESYKNV